MRTIFPLALFLCLAACGGSTPNPSNEQDPGGFIPPRTRAPTPLPGQAHSNPITAYIGKYPTETLNGVTFFDRTEVANALIAAVGDPKLRTMITAPNAVTVPIFAVGERIAAHGCEPHDCAARNWTFLIAPDGARAEACFHDEAAMGNSSRWYDNDKPVAKPGGCPTA